MAELGEAADQCMSASETKFRLLVVEDSDSDFILLEHSLSEIDDVSVVAERAATRREACSLIADRDFDLVVYDLTLPDSKGIDGFSRFVTVASSLPVIVLTGIRDPNLGPELVAAGAQDFISKGNYSPDLLGKTLRYAFERHKWVKDHRLLIEKTAYAQQQDGMAAFAAGIAHDIGNMLTPVLMSAETGLLLAKDETLHELFGDIRRSSGWACDLARQLLAMRGQYESQELERIPAKRCIERALSLIERTLPYEVTLSRSISEELDSRLLELGLTNMQQVLFNLCNNSAQALLNRGEGRIDVAADYESGSDSIIIEVRDNGPGFPSGSLGRVFDPFYTTREKKGGTGMGLAMCREIVSRRKGSIEAINPEGGGACVSFSFPCCSEPEWPAETKNKLLSLSGSGDILMIDDDRESLENAKRLFSVLGYSLDIFSDPEKALEALVQKKGRYDLVVVDYAMEAMNGLRLARRIKESCKGVPVVLSTAYTDLIDRTLAKESGISRVLRKPHGAAEIVESLRKFRSMAKTV